MGKCCRYAQCIGWLCLVVCSLRADPIPTLTANSASAGIGEAEGCEANLGCQFVFSASGDSFSLSGSGFSGSDYRNPVPPLPHLRPHFFRHPGNTRIAVWASRWAGHLGRPNIFRAVLRHCDRECPDSPYNPYRWCHRFNVYCEFWRYYCAADHPIITFDNDCAASDDYRQF
jgi:hypothetical protein